MMIELFLIVICSVFVIYLAGSIITGLFSLQFPDNYQSFLVKIITGLVSLIFLFSVIKTRGNTVNLIIVVPFFLFLYYLRSGSSSAPGITGKPQKRISIELQPLLLCLAYCLIWFIWQYTLYFNNLGENTVYGPYGEAVFYIDIVNSLKDTGAENTNTIKNVFFSVANERIPYHYFELWLSASISSITGVTSAVSVLLLVPVLFFVLNSIIIYSIARHFRLNNIICLLSPVLIFFVPFIMQFPLKTGIISARFGSYVDSYIYSYVSLLKFHVYLFFLLGIIFFYFRNRSAFIFLALVLPVASFTSVPAVMGMICIYLFYNIRNKTFNRNFWLTIITSFLIIVFLGLYYRKAFSLQGEGITEVSSGASYVKTIINIAGGTFLQIIYVFAPYFIFLFLVSWISGHLRILYSKQNIQLYIHFAFAFVCGLLGWSIIHRQLNSHQFFSNFFICSMIALFIFQVLLIASQLRQNKMQFRLIFLTVLAGFMFYSANWNYNNHVELTNGRKPFSREFYEDVNKLLNTSVTNQIGVCFYSNADYKIDPDIINSVVSYPAQVFKLEHNNFYVVSLTDLLQSYNDYNTLERIRNEALKRNSVFSKWLEKTEAPNSAVIQNIAQHQLAFIRENKIQFGIASRNAIIPPEFEAIKQREITDSISGYRFFLLKSVD